MPGHSSCCVVKKSNESASPSYVPKIFPSIYRSKVLNESVAISRYRRFMKRRKKDELSNSIPTNQPFSHSLETYEIDMTLKSDQECQVDIFSKSNNAGNTFTCNRYIYNQVCDAEVQTEIGNSTLYLKNDKEMKDKVCKDVANSIEKTDCTGFLLVLNIAIKCLSIRANKVANSR